MLGFLICCALSSPLARAQAPTELANPAAPPVTHSDTARVRPPTAAARRKQAAADSLKRTEKLFGFRVTRPAKAGYLALVPGLGQVYNHRWWKLPVVYAALGTTIGFLIYEQRGLNEYGNATNLLLFQPALGTAFPNSALGIRGAGKARSADEITFYLESFRHYRDGFIFYTAAAYGLQVLDAIVDAHLHEFDVSDNLSMHWQPTLLPVAGPAAGLPLVPGFAIALRAK